MSKYRDKLANKIKKGYSRKTLFIVYLLMILIIGSIILLAFFDA